MKWHLIGLLALFLQCGAAAEESEEESEIIVIKSDQVHQGDFFARGKTIEISGVVEGDVYLFGSHIFIDGTIMGDALIIGGNVQVLGKVENNIRVVGGQFLYTGTTGKNITLVAGNGDFSSSSYIGGNLTAVTGNLNLDGKIENNALVFSSNLRASDGIGGNLKVYASEMRLTSKVRIGKNLEYWSNTTPLIDSKAVIEGDVILHPSFFSTIVKGKLLRGLKLGSKFIGHVMNFLYTFALGMVLLYFFKPKVQRTLDALSEKPLEAFIYGLLVVILLPLISLMMLMTIIGVPFALTLFALNVIGFFTAKIFSILWVVQKLSCKIGYERHKKLYFSLGLIIYFVLISIPIAGLALSAVAMLFGLGGMVLGSLGKTSKTQRGPGIWETQ